MLIATPTQPLVSCFTSVTWQATDSGRSAQETKQYKRMMLQLYFLFFPLASRLYNMIHTFDTHLVVRTKDHLFCVAYVVLLRHYLVAI